MASILLVDDEVDILHALRIYLLPYGYEVLLADNGGRAIEILKERPIDLVLLDIMMPEMDGIETIRRIRSFSNVPVIFLSARGEEEDKIAGLEEGADDYISKPFSASEVIARVRSQLRRYQNLGGKKDEPGILVNGGIRLNEKTKEVSVDGEPVHLTRTELRLLEFFMTHCGKTYSSSVLYQACWDEEPINGDNAMAVHIHHLREKIEADPSHPEYLQVEWGRGYRMEDLSHVKK